MIFAAWCNTENEECMYIDKQIKTWSFDHLRDCHWYIEMPEKKTPPVEASYRRIPTASAPVAASDGKGKAKEKSKAISTKDTSKAMASKAGKCGARASQRELSKRGKTQHVEEEPKH